MLKEVEHSRRVARKLAPAAIWLSGTDVRVGQDLFVLTAPVVVVALDPVVEYLRCPSRAGLTGSRLVEEAEIGVSLPAEPSKCVRSESKTKWCSR